MVKRRTQHELDPAAIAAFGAGADTPVELPRAEEAVTAVTPSIVTPVQSSAAWPAGVPKALQLRFKDPEIALMLQQLTRKLDRSQHDTAMRAFRRGVEEMLKDRD